MSVYRDKNRDTWIVSCRCKDADGEVKRACKRGFLTEGEALRWEEGLVHSHGVKNMTVSEFFKAYTKHIRPTVTESTWQNKEQIFKAKIEPHLGDKVLSELTPQDALDWQDKMRSLRKPDGGPYSQTYLRSLNNQLEALLNHADNVYGIRNPMKALRKMGSKNAGEMQYWTKSEYLTFSEQLEREPMIHCAFEVLYWCGLRQGELLALAPNDIDFGRGVIMVRKPLSYVNGRYVESQPKPSCSRRNVQMSPFLEEEIAALVELKGIAPLERLFDTTKHSLRRRMDKATKAAGLKRIRIHDLRHSHVSLLIDMGFPATAIAERMGHTSIAVTYRYAHLFPTRQAEIALALEKEGAIR